ncbi:GPP34 family phosphoprotein, partial [Cellulomonas hominis]|nr:GPP34 family phosphoprotein [Cellulomonas hominis]
MLLAEDLLLLLLDDVRGSTPAVPVDEALGGAVLAELALAGAVVVVPGGGWGRSARVVPAV